MTQLPGDKAMVYVGWGLGTYAFGQVWLGEDYTRARNALARGGIPVHVLDVTSADAHSLEIGLEQVAADSGGTYASTFRFPDQGPRRIAGALAGRYVLTVVWPPDLALDRAPLAIELRGRRATVLIGPG